MAILDLISQEFYYFQKNCKTVFCPVMTCGTEGKWYLQSW